jgi:hypothetical protein
MAMTLILIMSVMAVSLTYLSRGEALSSMNYRLMSQARDAAEAGVNQASNYLMYTYATPGDAVGSDPITGVYNLTVSPVTAGGNAVVLSADGSVPAAYPVTSVRSAFYGSARGSVAAGTTTINYSTSARLLFMRELSPLPAYLSSGGNNTVQTWEITSTGRIAGVQPATVSVVAKLERHIVPVFAYAAFATDPGCGALTFGGGGDTNSYNSALPVVAGPNPIAFSVHDGNVGTNGGLDQSGSTTNIGGSLSTPRLGVGQCSANNVTAWDNTNGTLQDGIVQLPTTVSYPTPTIPPPGTDDLATNSGCPVVAALPAGSCSVDGSGHVHLDPSFAGGTISLRNVSMTGNKDLYLKGGTPPVIYNFNSIEEVGNTMLKIEGPGSVVINITGNGFANNQDPIKLSGGGISNPGPTGPPALPPDPSRLQIAYAGTAGVKLAGNTNSAALVYAPNASASITGGTNFFGSLIAKTIRDFGGAAVHYDRKLKTQVLKAGPYTLDSFNWKKF